MTKISRKCPFCRDFEFGIEKWNTNLYLLKCLNPKTAASMWVQQKKNGRFAQVKVVKPQEKQKISSYNKQEFDKIQIPFWKMMGQKPNAQDEAYEKYLKWKGMSYGEAVFLRNQGGSGGAALDRFNQHGKVN